MLAFEFKRKLISKFLYLDGGDLVVGTAGEGVSREEDNGVTSGVAGETVGPPGVRGCGEIEGTTGDTCGGTISRKVD